MYIVFHADKRISENGFAVQLCKADQVYDILPGTACWAIRNEFARKATDNEVIEYLYQIKMREHDAEMIVQAMNNAGAQAALIRGIL